MTLPHAILLAIVEGITEFLPISSTGHLLLAERYLSIPNTDFSKSFIIIIQFAAILSVVWLFRHKLLSFTMWRQIIFAFVPTGLIGLLSYSLIKNILFENPNLIVYSLFIGGLFLLLVDRLPKITQGSKTLSSLSNTQLLSIGLFQSLSIVPGVSRSAATIVGSMISGLTRVSAVEFSFFLAIPTMMAATGYDLLKVGLSFTTEEYALLLVGCIVSFLSALVTIRTFLRIVKQHDFTYFAIYRIILAIIVWLTINS